MKYLFDTHAWFWSLEMLDRLPAGVRAVLSNPGNAPFGISVMSLWEFAKLVQKGRIKLTVPVQEWVRRALDPDLLELVPLSAEIAVDSAMLPDGFCSDPVDEILVATARLHGAMLITADKKLRSYRHVKTFWE
jgi:PIN domain nuclease of toxin-antitoxin system